MHRQKFTLPLFDPLLHLHIGPHLTIRLSELLQRLPQCGGQSVQAVGQTANFIIAFDW